MNYLKQTWLMVGMVVAALMLGLAFFDWPAWLLQILVSRKAFFSALLNGVTVAGLYFVVAAGFTLIFGLMRIVNMAHGTLYLLGAYIGYEASTATDSWILGAITSFVVVAIVGGCLQVAVFRRMGKDDLRQALVSIGITVLIADLMQAVWGGETYQIPVPTVLSGSVRLPIMTAIKSDGTAVFLSYPAYRLFVLASAIAIGLATVFLLKRTRVGLMVRAGVDDPGMLSASGVNVNRVFVGVFALGAGMAGVAGLIGGTALSISPGEDIRYLLASLIVVIVGGMGSIGGAAIGALLVGLTEQLGLVYFPAYSAVFMFLIMVVTLMVRPEGIMGRARR